MQNHATAGESFMTLWRGPRGVNCHRWTFTMDEAGKQLFSLDDFFSGVRCVCVCTHTERERERYKRHTLSSRDTWGSPTCIQGFHPLIIIFSPESWVIGA